MQEVNFLRNIFGRKCHELYFGRVLGAGLACLLAAAFPAAGQVPIPQQPVVGAPPPAAVIPNAANPDQRLTFTRPGAPAADEYRIESDTQEVDGDLRHLRGHVHLETIDKKFDADAVDWNEDTGDVEAWGNVRYENFLDGTKLTCDRAKYNINTENGVFYNIQGTSEPRIVSRPGLLTTNNPFYFEGQWGERRDGKYIIHDGYITDCRVPRPWWRLTSQTFDITPNEKAVTHHAVFYVRKAPIFYFPYYFKSLKKLPRQSGFLTPNIGHSTQYGEMFGLGYYWAINRSYDLLYRFQYFTLRGPANTLAIRGKVRPGTDFTLNLYAVEDRGINIGNGVIQDQGGQDLSFDGRSDLGRGWEALVHFDYLSSFLFRLAFSQSFHDTIFSETHSVGVVSKHWSTFNFDVASTRDEEFKDTNPLDRILIKKIPQGEFSARDTQLLTGRIPLWFSFSSSAGELDRIQPTFQTATFVPREDVYPELTTTLHFLGSNVAGSFAVRETGYGSSFVNGAPATNPLLRSAREVRLDILPPSLERIYQSPKWLGGEKVKHVIEPRVQYHYVDGINNFNDVIRFDEADLMSDTNSLTLSLTNRLFVKDKDGNVNELMSWEVAQQRYFDPTFGGALIPGQRNVVADPLELDGFAFLDGPRNYSPIMSTLRFQHVFGFEWRMDYDPLFARVTNSTFNGTVRLGTKYFFSLGHTEVHTDPVISARNNQINALIAIGNQNRKGWNAAFNAYYDYHRDILDFATTEVTYNTDCCGISVEYRRYNFGIRDDVQYRLSFTVANIGSFGNMRRQERIY